MRSAPADPLKTQPPPPELVLPGTHPLRNRSLLAGSHDPHCGNIECRRCHRPFARISQQRTLQVELDGGLWRCAADDRIAFGWRVQRLWRVGELAFDQATLAVVAYA
jgi:hypothetical protein